MMCVVWCVGKGRREGEVTFPSVQWRKVTGAGVEMKPMGLYFSEMWRKKTVQSALWSSGKREEGGGKVHHIKKCMVNFVLMTLTPVASIFPSESTARQVRGWE